MLCEEENNNNKVIFLGESSVGKTNLIKISIGKPFDPQSLSTWTSSYVHKEIIHNNKKYIFNLWDTIGQEKYRALTKLFFKNAIIVILVYDITKRASFEALEFWVNEVKDILENNCIFAIVANKSDLFDVEEVPVEEGEEYAKSKGAKFILTSAKIDPTGFTKFLEKLCKEYIDKNKDIQNQKGLSIKGKNLINNDNKGKKCC